MGYSTKVLVIARLEITRNGLQLSDPYGHFIENDSWLSDHKRHLLIDRLDGIRCYLKEREHANVTNGVYQRCQSVMSLIC